MNLLRNIAIVSALVGIPLARELPPPRRAYPEAEALAVELGCSYEDAERVWMRYGTERAREVLTTCLEHNVVPDNDVLSLLFDLEPTTGEQMQRLARAQLEINRLTKRNDILDLAIYGNGELPRRSFSPSAPPPPKKRPLAEKKARRAKRKQRRVASDPCERATLTFESVRELEEDVGSADVTWLADRGAGSTRPPAPPETCCAWCNHGPLTNPGQMYMLAQPNAAGLMFCQKGCARRWCAENPVHRDVKPAYVGDGHPAVRAALYEPTEEVDEP